MPRKRDTTIHESLEELQKLEKRYKGKPEAARLVMLRLLKEDPNRGIEDVALLNGVSVPTVKRWWRAYREGGIESMLKPVGRKQAESVDRGIETVKRKIAAGELQTMADLWAWMTSFRESLPAGVNSGSTDRAQAIKGEDRLSPNGMLAAPSLSSDALLRFLSSLPVTHDLQEWVGSFREALQTLLPDIDRVTISLNIHCDLVNPEGYQPDMFVSQSLTTGTKEVNSAHKGEGYDEDQHLGRLLDSLRRRKFPFNAYHTYHSFVYYYKHVAYLGVILLWRERHKPPISETTLQIVGKLESFMVLLLSDFVARHQVAKPVEHAFNLAFTDLTRKTGLTDQEQRIIVLQLLGFSYEEVAETLNISLNTVRYHLRSIYTKTGAHGQSELFAKYFTPRIDPQHSQK